MKTLFIAFLLILSTHCFGQVDPQALIGNWEYSNTTTLNDSVMRSSPVNKITFEICEDGNFSMDAKDYSILGHWVLENSLLTLVGTRTDINETRKDELIIYSISESKLSFIMNLSAQKALLNFVKVKTNRPTNKN